MAKTKITQTPRGWVDDDSPAIYYRTRREARAARRCALTGSSTPSVVPSRIPTAVTAVPRQTNVVVQNFLPPLTSLQDRLYDRMVNQQGVSHDDAVSVVKNNGHNKAASYGHMREAGATHHEALIVINFDDPVFSVAYGKARSSGSDHVAAIQEALRGNST